MNEKWMKNGWKRPTVNDPILFRHWLTGLRIFPEELSSVQDSDLAWLDGAMQSRPRQLFTASTFNSSWSSPFPYDWSVCRISMEGAWWWCHCLWCCWWDRKHFSPTGESLPKSSTYPSRPTWMNQASKEWGMAKGIPRGHKSFWYWYQGSWRT